MKYSGHSKLLCELSKLSKLNVFKPPRILIPPRENWFQYVRRVYATAINFPCIIFLLSQMLFPSSNFCRVFFSRLSWTQRTMSILFQPQRSVPIAIGKLHIWEVGTWEIPLLSQLIYQFAEFPLSVQLGGGGGV